MHTVVCILWIQYYSLTFISKYRNPINSTI
jgi:hypothetical protein